MATSQVLEARQYDERYYQGRDRTNPMWLAEAHAIKDLLGDTSRNTVVDVGCGTGDLLALLNPATGIGTEINASALTIARREHPRFQFVPATGFALPVPDGSLDGVVNQHLIEHFADPTTAVIAWHRALKPGGSVVLVTPNAAFGHPEVFNDPDHKVIYSAHHLWNTFTEHGFSVTALFSMGAWAVRKAPFLWRYQSIFWPLRLPRIPGLRWRGQSLVMRAVKN
jgi:SAM-dependent methyltransferase